MHHIVVTGKPEIFHQADFGSQRVIVGRHHPALKGIDEFGGVKTENLGFAEIPNHLTFVGTTERMGRVKNELEIATIGDFNQFVDGARPAPEMDPDDTRCFWRDQAFNFFWVNGVGGRVNIAENRGDFLLLKGMGRGDKGERGNDDFAGKTQPANDNF